MNHASDLNHGSQQEPLPMRVNVKVHTLHTDGPILADVSVDLNGCFAIRGVKVVEGRSGPFVSMPSYKSRDGYKDICFPCTKEFRQQFQQAVLDACQQTLSQHQREEPNLSEQEEPDQSEQEAFEMQM